MLARKNRQEFSKTLFAQVHWENNGDKQLLPTFRLLPLWIENIYILFSHFQSRTFHNIFRAFRVDIFIKKKLEQVAPT